jgi:hypothetical protein
MATIMTPTNTIMNTIMRGMTTAIVTARRRQRRVRAFSQTGVAREP